MQHWAPKAITAAFAGVLIMTGFGHFSSTQASSKAASAALIAKGKGLVTLDNCNSCHGKDLKGKAKFSPSLRASGVLKEYNSKTWARVLNTGVTNDGGMVKSPMPVYKMSKADSAALWAYLLTQK